MIKKFKLKEIFDKRGSFLKVFEKNKFKNFNIKDVYISTSKKDVFRGMHYQTDKYAQNKIIICLKGGIIDFVVPRDLI